MKTSFWTYVMLMVVMLGSPGCYYDNEEELYPSNFCVTENISFNTSIRPLIQTRCALPGCHAGMVSPDLTQDQNIHAIANDGRLKARVIDRIPPAMPPTGPLPSCETQQLQAWLDQGAPTTN
jgi:hypothetical protein